VSLLVNNAGYVYGRTFMELPDREIEKTFKVNVLSHYWVSLTLTLKPGSQMTGLTFLTIITHF